MVTLVGVVERFGANSYCLTIGVDALESHDSCLSDAGVTCDAMEDHRVF